MDDHELSLRFDYHPPSTEGVASTHEAVRGLAGEFARALDNLLPDGREKSLVMTHVGEAMFWANAAIARNQHDGS